MAALLVFTAVMLLLGAYVQAVTSGPFQPVSAGTYPAQGAAGQGAVGQRAATPVAADAGVPVVSRVQGAQDAPRAELPEGAEVDMKRCMATMLARREPENEARAVCTKLIGGMGGR